MTTETDGASAPAKKTRAKKAETTENDGGPVKVRITRFGAGQVSTGQHEAGTGDVMHEEGDELTIDRDTAEALQERGFVEIQ